MDDLLVRYKFLQASRSTHAELEKAWQAGTYKLQGRKRRCAVLLSSRLMQTWPNQGRTQSAPASQACTVSANAIILAAKRDLSGSSKQLRVQDPFVYTATVIYTLDGLDQQMACTKRLQKRGFPPFWIRHGGFIAHHNLYLRGTLSARSQPQCRSQTRTETTRRSSGRRPRRRPLPMKLKGRSILKLPNPTRIDFRDPFFEKSWDGHAPRPPTPHFDHVCLC